MLSGSQTLSSIERAILDVRSEENRVATILQSATEEVVQLRAQQAQNFKALAALKLDALASENVTGDLDLIERRALELLEHRRRRLEQATLERSKATEEASEAETEHAQAASAVEAAVSRIEELTSRVETSIKSDPEWIATQQRIEQAESTTKAAADKATQSETDRDSKRKPYESDPLFAYLWRSGYGTSTYRGGAIRRYFDGKVAKLVGYDSARVNYHMLTEIPLLLRGHANRLGEQSKAELAKRSAIERRALEAADIVALENDLGVAQAALKQAEARLSRANAALSALDAHQTSGTDEQRDPEYRQAVEMLAERLGREDLTTLYQQALATPSSSDDRIVQSLQRNEQAIAKAEAQVAEVRKNLVQIANRRAELEQSRSRFNQAGYNNPMGGFVNGAVIGGVLGGILNGSRSSGNLDSAFNDGFRWRVPQSGGFGGGMRFPGGGSWGGGGGSLGGDGGGSLGGGDSGGSFGGGGSDGFQTGGGF